MHAIFQKARHSAEVGIELIVGEKRWRVAQLGPDFVILDETSPAEAGLAKILLRVDGEDEQWTVRLMAGALPAGARVPIQQV